MANYIDGFVFPVPRDRLNDYKRLVEAVAETVNDIHTNNGLLLD